MHAQNLQTADSERGAMSACALGCFVIAVVVMVVITVVSVMIFG